MVTKATAARPTGTAPQAIPQAFLPVVPQFIRSPVPVFFPTWLPVLHHRFYPSFCVSRHKFVGPAYELGLYTSPHICDHAHRVFEIFGVAGDNYAVNTDTRPVWLGTRGWAYIDPDGNAGWTISFVRAVGHGMYPPECTYTVLGACQEGRIKRLFACLKHIARSVRRYVARRERELAPLSPPPAPIAGAGIVGS